MGFGITDFLTRHRRKFIVTGAIVGGSYIALRFMQRKLIEIQERQTREFFDKTRRIHHFESTEHTCNQVIIGMSAELYQAIIEECSINELLAQLRQNPPNKKELWDDIKIETFTRITTFIYASAMLVVALRVQLNVIGGYVYYDIVNEQKKISELLRQQYLALIRFFIHNGGLIALVQLIRSKVISVMKNIPLKKLLSLSDLEQLFWSLQIAINSDPNDPNSKIGTYLLPSKLPDLNVDPLLRKMYNETLDLFESDDASTICSNSISRGFSLAVDAIAENWSEGVPAPDHSSTQLVENNAHEVTNSRNHNNIVSPINNIQIPLAKLIPIVNGLTAKGFDSSSRPQNFATSLITFFVVSEKTKLLGANIYETFCSSP